MKKYEDFKETAIKMRESGKSLNDITYSLSVPKTTIYYWIKHIPLKRNKLKPNIEKMVTANKSKWQQLYDDAYNRGVEIFNSRKNDDVFKCFIILFMAEGYRKSTNTVELVNTSPSLIKLAVNVMSQFCNTLKFKVFYHADRDINKIIRYWCDELDIIPSQIKLQLKHGNSLNNRSLACDNGIMHVYAFDYKFRHMLRAWSDLLSNELDGKFHGI